MRFRQSRRLIAVVLGLCLFAAAHYLRGQGGTASSNAYPCQQNQPCTHLRLKLTDQGQCTMSSGVCSAQNLGSTYSAAPLIVLQWTGTGTCAGPLKYTDTTTTVTPASNTGTDTCQVNWFAFGN